MFIVKKLENKNKQLNYLHISSDVVSCKIYPNLGGSMQELSFNKVEIIDGISHSEKGLKEFEKTYASAFLFPFPGRIEKGKYSYKNKSYQLEINDITFSNAIHGLIASKPFEVLSCKIEKKEVVIDLNYGYDGGISGFPFPFKFKITYHISNNNVRLNCIIYNTGNSSFPFGLGWHPYFLSKKLKESEMNFSSETEFVCNEFMIPIDSKKRAMHNPFRINEDFYYTTYKLSDNKVNFITEKYKMEMDVNNNIIENYLQIYTPEDRGSLAIEVMTCPPNGFNNKKGFLELAPNETFNCSFNLNISINA